ncbi:hypothetical protein ACOEKA_004599 [Vibrio parahaemolyticus]|uniref:hypothetical protein n=1 Tax=Vibrio parahaemolyticus TaxID=670 RepID=UPI00111F9E89|nr:hypothetical protein [Vibrio parahaemolyticus]EJG1065532.1 hypothetical protein [Vibrio parahaemolyticus O1]TOC10538.1 hypothetical protein CGJ91_23475 [Vibrio parahaemolyticus]WMO08239.1 hypothetical protein NI377_09420 [Vibrio parahaemolyticus]
MSSNDGNNNSSEDLSMIESVSLTVIVIAIIFSTLMSLFRIDQLENEELYSWLTIASAVISIIWGVSSAKKTVKVTLLLGFFILVLVHFLKFVG